MANVQFTDNSAYFKKELGDKLPVALEAIAQTAESYAKINIGEPKEHADGTNRPNVITGRLRNSISHAIAEDTAYIGTNVEYAAYVEMGTSRMRAYPYLKPAVTDHIDEYKELAKTYLKD